MVPAPLTAPRPHSSRLIYALLSVVFQNVPKLFRRVFPADPYTLPPTSAAFDGGGAGMHSLGKRTFDPHNKKDIVFACLIPVLVCMSGLFAGLTLGYMSLDETQLNVLSISGTPYVSLSR